MIKKLKFEDINLSVQTRVKMDEKVIHEYAQAMRDEKDETGKVIRKGDKFPLCTVYAEQQEGKTTIYYLADGHHRFHAMKENGLTEAEFEVKQGTQKDAILFNIKQNLANGLRMTNADKKRAVCLLLKDERFKDMSDREKGKICGVDHKTVGKYSKMYKEGKDPLNEETKKASQETDKEPKENAKDKIKALTEEIERLTAINTHLIKENITLSDKLKSDTINGKLNRGSIIKLIHPDRFAKALEQHQDLFKDLEKAVALINSAK